MKLVLGGIFLNVKALAISNKTDELEMQLFIIAFQYLYLSYLVIIQV